MWDFIKSIFQPAVDLVDELHVSDEERLQLRNELAKIQSEMHSKTIDLMKSEASSDNWLTSGWRPLCALMLFGLIVLDAYKVVEAPTQIYSLAELFLGVYGGGRSAEKVAKIVKGVIK